MTRMALCVVVLLLMVSLVLFGGACSKQEPEAATPTGTTGTMPELAEPGDEPAAAGEVTLTPEIIKNWQACADEVGEVAPELDEIGGAGEDVDEMDWAAAKAAIDKAGANKKVQDIVKEHGFASGEEWAQVTGKMIGITFIAMEEAFAGLAALGEEGEEEDATAKAGEMRKEIEKVFGPVTEDEIEMVKETLGAGGEPLEVPAD